MRRHETSEQAARRTTRQRARSIGWLLLRLAVVIAATGCGPQPGGGSRVGGGHRPAHPGAACEVASDCGADTPACVEGRCQECRYDGDCVRFSDCRACAPAGGCLPAPGCCRGDLDCPSTFACDRAPGAPIGRCVDEEDLP